MSAFSKMTPEQTGRALEEAANLLLEVREHISNEWPLWSRVDAWLRKNYGLDVRRFDTPTLRTVHAILTANKADAQFLASGTLAPTIFPLMGRLIAVDELLIQEVEEELADRVAIAAAEQKPDDPTA